MQHLHRPRWISDFCLSTLQLHLLSRHFAAPSLCLQPVAEGNVYTLKQMPWASKSGTRDIKQHTKDSSYLGVQVPQTKYVLEAVGATWCPEQHGGEQLTHAVNGQAW